MANSLETRVPFLDHRLVEFMTTVPSHYRLNGKTTKYLLKKAMKDRLPESILTRGKEGFSIPIKNWMKNELKPMTLDALSANQLKKTGYFESEYVHRLIDEHLQGRENHSHRLWALLMFQLWYQKHMDN
jgi:asparagine synthase (glutamine-hydrolysing)